MMGIKFERQKEKYKITLIAILLVGSCFLTYYFHVVLETGTVFTHFLYIPIILASLWWKRKGLAVAIFLAVFLIFSHHFLRDYVVTANDYLRALMFVVIASLVAFLRERIAKSERMIRETHDYLDNLFNYANAPIIVWDPEGRITRFNHAFEHLTGYKTNEVIGKELSMLFPGASQDESLSKIERTLSGEYWESVEIPILRKDGDIRVALWNSANIYAEDGTTIIATIAQGQDVTKRKQAEHVLKKREKELEIKTNNLEDSNTALKVLLKTRDEDKIELEEKVLSNVKKLNFPYMEKLKKSRLDERQMKLLSIIESSLDDIIAPFSRKLALKYSNFTPKEIEVAGLVKEGKTTKEIAELLTSTIRAIEFHRNNLRKKLGLKDKKANLRSYLLSLK